MSAEIFHDKIQLCCGDSLHFLRDQPDNRYDSCVTDPPYALVSMVKRFGNADPAKENFAMNESKTGYMSRGFMGKAWDTGDSAHSVEFWAEVLRVLKPGGHVVAFAGTRTYHRMACAIEDAGFEVRDMLSWLYGSGFPKSHNVSKGIDKARRRDFVLAAVDLGVPLPGRSIDDWTKEDHAPGEKWWKEFQASLPIETWQAIERRVVGQSKSGASAWFTPGAAAITVPATDAGREWQGWGTALKPACEPICFARKPLTGTVAANVLKWGTGAINVDGCRVGDFINTTPPGTDRYNEANFEQGHRPSAYGRDGEASADKRYTENGSTNFAATPGPRGGSPKGRWPANIIHDGSEEVIAAFPESVSTGGSGDASRNWRGDGSTVGSSLAGATGGFGDSGSAARFFYTAKADSDDRLGSKHPTVKPVDLMQWLVRLVTPKGGLVLDPFAGTGTTAEACFREGMRCMLVERETEYQADIRRRMALVLGGPEERRRESIKAKDRPIDHGPLFEVSI